ncbi:hypothetical protein [Thalassotalea sp. G2M2-11]|uniref:hypothetical protein n=1 Tax=Thalassotalea sp. G2M2-11 TaxID=2787627 RepID=UPI0019D009BD|nr:hypothetical protein [Thalassotalea sp. G2M2-11]
MNVSYLFQPEDYPIELPIYTISYLLERVRESHRYYVAIKNVREINGYSLNRHELKFSKLLKTIFPQDSRIVNALKLDYCDDIYGFTNNEIYIIFFLVELSGLNLRKTVSQLHVSNQDKSDLMLLIDDYDKISESNLFITEAINPKELYEFLRAKRKKSTQSPKSQFIDNVVNEIGHERFAELGYLLRSRDLTFEDVAKKYINKTNNQTSEDKAMLLVTEWQFTSALVIGIMHSKEFIRGSNSLEKLHCARREHEEHYTFKNFAIVYATVNQRDHKQMKNSEILAQICKQDMERLVELQQELCEDPELLSYYC